MDFIKGKWYKRNHINNKINISKYFEYFKAAETIKDIEEGDVLYDELYRIYITGNYSLLQLGSLRINGTEKEISYPEVWKVMINVKLNNN